MSHVVILFHGDRSGIQAIFGPYPNQDTADQAQVNLKKLPMSGLWEIHECQLPASTDTQDDGPRPLPPGRTIARSAGLPSSFAATLRAMYTANDTRLNATLLAARNAGWTLQAMADQLGMTREAVRLRTTKATRPLAALPEIPSPPAYTMPELKPAKPPQPQPTDETRAQLVALQEIAKTVNGGTPVGHPARLASVELSALLANEVNRGVPLPVLATMLGVTYGAIRTRLARHGYKPNPPSQRSYMNRQVGGAPAATT
jgi:hypothetical protein